MECQNHVLFKYFNYTFFLSGRKGEQIGKIIACVTASLKHFSVGLILKYSQLLFSHKPSV